MLNAGSRFEGTTLPPRSPEVTHVPYVDCEKLAIDSDVLKLLPRALAKRCCALPLQMEGTTKLVMVIAEPQNLQIIDELRFSTGMEIVRAPGVPRRNRRSHRKIVWGRRESRSGQPSVARGSRQPRIEFISSSSLRRKSKPRRKCRRSFCRSAHPAVRLVASMITVGGRQTGQRHPYRAASHRCRGAAARGRYSCAITREFRNRSRLPLCPASRFLANMDIARAPRPQHGRFLVKTSERRLDLRVSTLPTQYGEKVVIRLAGAERPVRDFATLDFPLR